MEYFENDLIRNFDNNISLNDDNIDDIRKNVIGKNVILIAAGPSLENELVSLKAVLESNERQNICVICVGKISRKLLENKIKPDYIR